MIASGIVFNYIKSLQLVSYQSFRTTQLYYCLGLKEKNKSFTELMFAYWQILHLPLYIQEC